MVKKIFIVAGDPSGDLHGANLVNALREISSEIEISGLGGERMERAGVKLLDKLTELAIVGFSEAINNIRALRHVYRKTQEFLIKERPDIIVLIDYPGFNLRLAGLAKRLKIPLIYYIGPQIWAWRHGRIKDIAELVNKMLVIFPFEEETYRKAGVNVSFVGHPLLDNIQPTKSKEEVCQKYGLDPSFPIIGLMPGSRKQEIERLLPVMLEASQKIAENRKAQFVLPLAENIPMTYIRERITEFETNTSNRVKKEEKTPLTLLVVRDEDYNIRRTMTLALVASGTATLENACLGIPMIIIYKVSLFSYLLARLLIRIPRIGLANIVAGKRVVPEFIQQKARAEEIAKVACHWLSNPGLMRETRKELKRVKQKLGTPGASKRAAKIILEEATASN
ncbi:lipid-A-disaccharide synthase [bacterium]|nr:lipid-A-disaccharide synthase [bacterium]NIN92572.1 lipid-A-disaccharide synthase [bacterium]NIO18614.1 lipid-A-disaccharide synthase [bacterium]NIO73629.1 lipid-A-disaccharide synthase [bacterium]